jgi:hypothetical protein
MLCYQGNRKRKTINYAENDDEDDDAKSKGAKRANTKKKDDDDYTPAGNIPHTINHAHRKSFLNPRYLLIYPIYDGVTPLG